MKPFTDLNELREWWKANGRPICAMAFLPGEWTRYQKRIWNGRYWVLGN